MQENDPNIRWVEESKLGLFGRMYLPLVTGSLATPSKHLVSKKVTVSYPDEESEIGNSLIYRGVHRLNKDTEPMKSAGYDMAKGQHGSGGDSH